MTNWNKVREEYKAGETTLKELAEKHDIKISTLKSRKSHEGWSRDPTQKDATQKKGAPLGNANSKGNRGNKHATPPKQNSNALKHGFYARHLPEEFLEIMDEV